MVFFISIQFFKETSVSNYSREHFAESDLVLHCFPLSHKKDTRLIWVKAANFCLIVEGSFRKGKYPIF